MDDVLLGSTGHSSVEFGGRSDRDSATDSAETSLQRVLDGLEEVVVGLALVLEGQSSVRHVVQVLQPLKVGDGDTSGVDVQIRNDKNLFVSQDGVAGRGDGSVCSLRNNLSLDLVSVALVDGLLHGGRDQDVTLFVQEVVLVTRVSFGLGEARDCAVIIAPVI